ncbi:kinase-like domain-containing protein [Baffinella frigidus]|nr:kinase-like domain-containing protein [Cryptophyta sp. CCMP2293]
MKILGPYELGKELGRGATGTVYYGFDPLLRKKVAVKFLKLSQNSRRSLDHEVEVMTKFAHENITAIHTVFVDDKNMMLSLEFIGGGELFDTVVKWKRDQRERQTFHYFNQLMNGLQYMHKQGFAHRDLKLENLLLSKVRIFS